MKFISQVLYGLYQLYKTDITVITFARTVNDETGAVSDNRIAYDIKAIMLPANMYVELFSPKGSGDAIQFDSVIIIDKKRFPVDVDNFENAYIVKNHVRYDIMNCEKYPQDLVYVLRCKANPGVPANNIINRSVETRIELDQTVS